MNKGEKKFIFLSFLLAGITGGSIFILDNFFKIDSHWGISSHPFLTTVKSFHYLVTPLLIFSIGLIFKDHISTKLKRIHLYKRKKTGLILCGALVLLTFSGQSLLIVTGEWMRKYLGYLHLGLGVISIVLVFIHSKTEKKNI
ncbi:MAG: hypothetical protein CME70_22435 [Halobacteriovorax sp.]|nr:hypothetical protein [Halobacteriovorax sp.]|tara:strand:- start:85012 stop:85437 length:426 start_codon:yes stop_codon:yes gene_type:complete